MRISAAALLLLTLALPVAAQEPGFGERVDVNLVLLDAVVTDSGGHQILGLGKDDFTVTENGVPQKIESVEYYTNRTLVTAPEEKAPFAVEHVDSPRFFVFFFDKPEDNQLWQALASARSAAGHFIDAMRPGDQVAIAGHDVRLKIYCDFTSDKAALHAGLNDVGRFSRGVTEGTGPILSHISRARIENETGTVYEALEALGDALRPTRGRKNIILFSAGIIERGQSVSHGMADESRFYRPMVDSLNAADVSVFAMNLMREDAPETPMVHQTLEQMAHDTGGEYWRHPVSFESLVHKVEQQTGGYYLISYYSHHPKEESGFQKVNVTVTRPEFHVQARAGYRYGA